MTATALAESISTTELDSPHLRIAAARRILYRAGLDSQIGGHVSLRVPGEDAFWVTPFQYFDETLPEHVSKVGFDLEVLEPGTLPASPGINFHASILMARSDANCVIHTHARNISMFASSRQPFDVYYVYGCLFLDGVAEFVDDPQLTPEREGAAIAAALGDKRVVVMPHHGSVHVGDTLENTVVETLVFDIACDHQLSATLTGAAPMDRDTASSYRQAYLQYGFREQMWLANLRRLRRSDPDLFDAAGV